MTHVQRRRADRTCVIGIDQSLSGFAVCALYSDGSHRVHRRAFPAKKSHGVDRLAEVGAWLCNVLDSLPTIDHVCMEGYSRQSKYGREEAGELGAVVKLALRTSPHLRYPACYPTIVAPTALKKYVVGTGPGGKSDIKMYVLKKWGVTFKDDNEADSYGLARIAAAIQWRDGELTGYQQEVLKHLRHHTDRNEDGDASPRDRERGNGARR